MKYFEIFIEIDDKYSVILETEKDFNEMYDFIKMIAFSKLHVFPYSRRKGTKADLMDNQIPEEIKKQRVKILLELSKQLETSK